MSARRVLLWCFLASLSATALLGVWALLFDSPYQEEIVVTGLLAAIYSLAALACASMIERGRSRAASWVSLAGQGVSFAGWLVMLWFHNPLPNELERLVVKLSLTFTFIGIEGLHVALLGLLALRRRLARAARLVAWAFATVAMVLVLLIVWEAVRDVDVVWRTVGSMLILGALGTLATPLLWRLERMALHEGEDATVARSVPVTLVCPRCGREQVVRSGRASSCEGCRLRLRVEVEEPRCDCGYLLYGLTSDVCPECGAPVPEERAWAANAPAAEA